MSETPPAPTPKKEVIAPRQESLAEEFADDPPNAERNYGDARLWLVARDPRCLFAYWEFRPDEHPDAVGADGRAQFFLRTYRDGNEETTIGIDPGAANVFVPAQSPDSGYTAELGFFSGEVWCFLARSGHTRTPPEKSAAPAPVVFATVPARIQSDARRHGEWTPEHERLLAEILGENAAGAEVPSASSPALTQRIGKKLRSAAIAAAPYAPVPAPHAEGDASSPAAIWPASPGAAQRL